MDEYTRSDFIDDSIVIDFEIPINIKNTLEDYIKAVENEDYIRAEDLMDDVRVDIKNCSSKKLSNREKDLLRKKYKIW